MLLLLLSQPPRSSLELAAVVTAAAAAGAIGGVHAAADAASSGHRRPLRRRVPLQLSTPPLPNPRRWPTKERSAFRGGDNPHRQCQPRCTNARVPTSWPRASRILFPCSCCLCCCLHMLASQRAVGRPRRTCEESDRKYWDTQVRQLRVRLFAHGLKPSSRLLLPPPAARWSCCPKTGAFLVVACGVGERSRRGLGAHARGGVASWFYNHWLPFRLCCTACRK